MTWRKYVSQAYNVYTSRQIIQKFDRIQKTPKHVDPVGQSSV